MTGISYLQFKNLPQYPMLLIPSSYLNSPSIFYSCLTTISIPSCSTPETSFSLCTDGQVRARSPAVPPLMASPGQLSVAEPSVICMRAVVQGCTMDTTRDHRPRIRQVAPQHPRPTIKNYQNVSRITPVKILTFLPVLVHSFLI